jgi:hypothetical protein
MKSWILWLIVVFSILGVVGFLLSRGVETVDNGISHYEDFQEIYTTTKKIDSDLATIQAVPETDKMFTNFSKAAMVAAKKQQMTRWIEEYNAKSKMINRSLWKSSTLPYQLNTNDFPNYKD